jgi:hypothetical protein
MSTAYNGVNYANTQASPIEQIEEGQYNSLTLRILDLFVLTADLVANDTINVGGPIPEGAVLLNAKIAAPVSLGGACALNFGYLAGAAGPTGSLTPQAASASAFFSAVVVGSAVTYTSAYGNAQQGTYYTQIPLSSQVQAQAVCTVGSSGATGKSLYFEVEYTKTGG